MPSEITTSICISDAHYDLPFPDTSEDLSTFSL